jgi:radical SAM superfamily enzyme with C-terminal helix-hairpin-helix motif
LYQKDDKIQQQRHNIKVREYEQRRMLTQQTSSINKSKMVDRNSPSTRIEEDLSLVKKVTSNGGIVKDLSVLQADNSEVYCNQFERNGL